MGAGHLKLVAVIANHSEKVSSYQSTLRSKDRFWHINKCKPHFGDLFLYFGANKHARRSGKNANHYRATTRSNAHACVQGSGHARVEKGKSTSDH